MSSTLDPAKLKVADLRNELSARGLDVKGTKPVLVKRLKDALEKETDKEIPDTSIADTSTEDLDETPTPRKSLRGSTDEKEETRSTRNAPTAIPPGSEKPKPVVKSPEKVEKPPQEKPAPEAKTTPTKVPDLPKPVAKSPAKPVTPVKPTEKPKVEVTAEVISPVKPEVEAKSPEKVQAETAKDAKTPEDKADLEQENGEQAEKMEVQEDSEKTADKEIKSESAENEGEGESKGEKRKRSGDSPERSQKRARSPIKEDEPEINAEAVQLSWFDSDLHLQVDKTSFLSAKPITDGAFGYVWAGARATYGVSTGKVCYEVKITEKIKWEEYQQRSDNRYRTDHRKSRRDDRRSPKRSEKSRSESEKRKENSESTNDEVEKKEENSEKKDEGMEVTPDEKKEETDDKITETADKVEETAKTEEPMETTENGDKIDDEKEEKSNEEKEETSKEEKEEKSKEDEEEKSKEEEEKPKEAKEKAEELPPLPTHFIRIGWSVASSSLQLGEDKNSYGYESSGKFVKEKEFTDCGITFDAEDVVGAFLDISPTTVTLQFTVNGQIQPSLEIPTADLPEDFVLYPHILSRNYSFEVNFGEKEEPLFAVPSELAADYQFIGKVEDKVAGLARPENRSDCEVILMCGLPASGKTHWTKEHLAANAEKNYTVLGTSTIFERMTISGESIKSKYRGKWGVLVDRVSKALNKLISLAALRRRNYIIDQTNVFPSAQRRKLRPFEGFKRKAVIVVNGEEEQARRQALQEALEGKEVPDSTLLEMKAAMVLPEVGDSLEEITYVGATEEEAKEIIKKYNAAGKAAGYGPEKKFNRDRWSYRRNDYRGGRNFQRQGSGGSGGYNRQPYSQNRWGPPRQGGSGGGWKQDSRSRDWRGSGGGGYDRRDRDYYNQGSYGGRSQQSSSSRQGGQRWGGSGGGGGWGNQGGWNQQSYGRNYNQGGGGWGSQGGGQQGGWGNKYGSSGSGGGQSQGQNYGGYNNWNYYGQQQQNWGGQK